MGYIDEKSEILNLSRKRLLEIIDGNSDFYLYDYRIHFYS